MWIRSQDKTTLTEVHKVDVNEFSEIYVNDFYFGEYSTKEKALKVLDRIEELIENQCGLTFYMPADDDVVMVKKRVDYAELRDLEVDENE